MAIFEMASYYTHTTLIYFQYSVLPTCESVQMVSPTADVLAPALKNKNQN